MLNGYTLFIAQLIAHLSLIPMFIYGNAYHWMVSLGMYFLSGCLGMTMVYHRLLSHRSWNAPKWFEYLSVIFATVGLTGSAIAWVAVHRAHHKYTETSKDPHSPHHKGIIYCQWGTMFEPVQIRMVPDLLRQSFYLLQHHWYFAISIVYAGILYFIDPFAIIYAWLVPACILWNAGSSINTIGHLFGLKQDDKSEARNNLVLGLLVWGEGWHGNHHKNQGSPYFSTHWWQIDIGGFLISIFSKIFYKAKLASKC